MAPMNNQFPPSVMLGMDPEQLLETESLRSSNPGSDGRLRVESGVGVAPSVNSDYDAADAWRLMENQFDRVSGLISIFNPDCASAPAETVYSVPLNCKASTVSGSVTDASGGRTDSVSLSILSEPRYGCDGSIIGTSVSPMVYPKYTVKRSSVLVRDSYTQLCGEDQDAGRGSFGKTWEVETVSLISCLFYDFIDIFVLVQGGGDGRSILGSWL